MDEQSYGDDWFEEHGYVRADSCEPLTEKLGQEGWELAGKVGVDLGCVIIGDPIMTQDFDWTTSPAVMTTDHAEVEAGVVVAAGWGDGTHPV